MQKITPFLWFNDNAEEAMNYYTSVFKNSKTLGVTRYGKNMPLPEGTVMTATFELDGQKFVALNGGPLFKFTEAVSFVINCEDQEEIDYYWNTLTGDGGSESQCGWLKDKFGLSWQVVPVNIGELVKNQGSVQALMGMKKLDIAALKAASTS
jgi:predicted 3-demethylubiquinone-9 3-methyltransferase (glyoxalase superfamily)